MELCEKKKCLPIATIGSDAKVLNAESRRKLAFNPDNGSY